MRITYWVLDPTGNVTILAETPVPEESQPALAARLMDLEPGAEQAGFVREDGPGDYSLRMAGGEFCGNASMCAAALYMKKKGLPEGEVCLSVSGAPGPVRVRIRREEAGTYEGTVSMPAPLAVREADLPGYGPCRLVDFPGISHAILERPLDRDRAEDLVRTWCRDLKTDALGLMLLDRKERTMTPLVYVPAAGTLFWENSCASGTSAVGAGLAEEEGAPLTMSLAQPGGSLTVEVSGDGSLSLTGHVRFLEKKEADLAL